MPNDCNNYLSVTGPYADVKRFFEEVKAKDSEGGETLLSFEKHVPMKGPEENWYHEHCNKWGTKWDAYDVDIHSDDVIKNNVDGTGEIAYSFQTAWAPPCEWLKAVVPMFPTLNFHMEYEECGCEVYGYSTGEDGEFTDTPMSLEEWLTEFNDSYQHCVQEIKKMSQKDHIKFFSRIQNFTDWCQEDEEMHEDLHMDVSYDFWPLAGTIIEALEVESLPFFINVDWCDEKYNAQFKSRMREGK